MELDNLQQELYDSKYISASRLKSLNAWKRAAKKWWDIAIDYKLNFEVCCEDRKRDRVITAKRLELLRRSASHLRFILADYSEFGAVYHPNVRGIVELINELEEEWGDDN